MSILPSIKGDEKFMGEDTREGITTVISVKLEDAQFESQTKAKLGNSEIRTLVEGLVGEKLAEYLEENPKINRIVGLNTDKEGLWYLFRSKILGSLLFFIFICYFTFKIIGLLR